MTSLLHGYFMNGNEPSRTLEKRLRQAIMDALHELVPEFRAHTGQCASCSGFHEWLSWQHREGTNEWHARCPTTGATLTLPFLFAGDTRGDQPVSGL
jgi:hypothetical protein